MNRFIPSLCPSVFPRRAFIEGMAKSCLGVSFGSLASSVARSNDSKSPKATSVIYLFMRGGMSHIDTFDPKPDAGSDIQGPVKSIATRVPGTQITEYLPRTASIMDRLALIRSMRHNQGAHEPGEYLVRTGFEKQTGIRHPSLGSWCTELAPKVARDLPSYVRVGDLGGHPANGFFEVRSGPIPISNPSKGLQNSRPTAGMSAKSFKKGIELTSRLDEPFRKKYDHSSVRAYGDLYDDAVRLMRSSELSTFDLTQEPKAIREKYGTTNFGQGCLLARRLVANGVGFVEVDFGDWDTHVANHAGVEELCKTFDDVVPTLVEDLASQGLLDSTLIVVATEFGRISTIDEFGGRGHWPLAFSCLLGGAGIQGGAIYGRTDDQAKEVIENEVSILDFNATIAKVVGISLTEKRSPSADAQVFRVVGKDTGVQGKPIEAILS